MLSNAYFLATFRFDTAENEPAKNLKMHFSKMHFRKVPIFKCKVPIRDGGRLRRRGRAGRVPRRGREAVLDGRADPRGAHGGPRAGPDKNN